MLNAFYVNKKSKIRVSMYQKILFTFVCTSYKEYLNQYTKYPIHSDYTEAEFLDEILTEVLRVFHLYSFALRFIFLQTPATSYRF
jgi:hypothetical protein